MGFNFFVLALSISLCLFYGIALNELSTEVCYDIKVPALKYSSSCTPYEFSINSTTEHATFHKFPGCTPVKMWLLIRHGSRTPNPRTIKLMNYLLPEIRHRILYGHKNGKGDLPEKTLNLFKNWSKVQMSESIILTEFGEKEMYELAKRYQILFPHLLPDIYSSIHYNFRHTMSERTKASALSFARGLFGTNEAKRLTLTDSLDDRLILKFQKHCRKWQKYIRKNPYHYIEWENFLDGPEIEQMEIELSYRLGLNETLSYIDIEFMFLACAAEFTSSNGKDSPWCYIFSKKDLEVIEYALDLKHYLKDSYGHKLNYEQACPIVKDMMDYLTDNSSWPPVVLSFTHFGTISKFYAALKMFYDKTPLSSKLNIQRKYKLSKIAPFATNFAIVVYRCDGSNEDKFLAILQEQPVTLPGCTKNDLCPISVLESNYNNTRNNCNFDKICKNKKIKEKEPKSDLSAIKDILVRINSFF